MDETRASGALPETHDLYAPGLKWRDRVRAQVPYWVPPAKDSRAGYIPKSLALDITGSQAEIAAACRRQWADLLSWRKGEAQPATNFTVNWLIGRYLNDELSPFQAVKPNTQTHYRDFCNIIAETIGDRRIDPKRQDGGWAPRILGDDVRRWHKNWGLPVALIGEDGKPVMDARDHPVTVAGAPSRARAAVTQFRMLIKYAVTIGVPGIRDLRDMLHDMRFKTVDGRTNAPTRDQVNAIVNKAEEIGALSVAITTLAQFELTERRIHIVGEWEGQIWRAGWTWPNYKHGVITYTQAKRGVVERVFDLREIPRLFALVESVPANQRFGAIIKREATGKPWQRWDYAKRFREIARLAEIPDDVWSMDMRAGGATETDTIAEVTDRQMQDSLGHKDPKTKERYRRNKQRNAQTVVRLRQANRDGRNT